MSFLTPWFLAGLVLVAGPVIAHLIRRATRERLTFSTLRFLDLSSPRLDRRSRVQNPWLLALRCLIVAVLATGFSRPFLRQETPLTSAPAVPRHVVAVLDESASMRRTGLWDAAREKITALVADLRPADRFVLLTAGTKIGELINAEQWLATAPENRRALVRAVLDAREPGWGPTPLDSAAEAALARWEDMAETAEGASRRELVIVSDFAAGAHISGLANFAWPPDTDVVLAPVTPAVQGNASLHWLGWSEQEPASPTDADVGGVSPPSDRERSGVSAPRPHLQARVRVSRSFDSPESLRLQWHDAVTGQPLGEPEPLTLLPGASEVRLVLLPENAPLSLRLDLTGDEQPFDNSLWLVRAAPREITISYLGSDATNDAHHARFYIERAIAGWRQPIAHQTTTLPENKTTPALLIIPEPLETARLAEVRARVEAGAFALVLLDRDELVATAAALAGESDWNAASLVRRDAMLGQLDFQHPLFSAFADPLYSDFTRIRFWQPRSVKLPPTTKATVVARFEDESPAVLEVPVGRGRVVVWGGGWTPTASQWVLSSKFVPWLQALAERAAGGAAQPTIAEIGDAARLVAPGIASQWRELSPTAAGQPSTETPSAPGVYGLTQGDVSRHVALLVPVAESKTKPLPLDTWEQLGVPLRSERSPAKTAAIEHQSRGNAATLENRQQLWRWLLWLAVTLLALESIASLAVSRHREQTA